MSIREEERRLSVLLLLVLICVEMDFRWFVSFGGGSELSSGMGGKASERLFFFSFDVDLEMNSGGSSVVASDGFDL
jgi:hypothetical protein